MTYARLSCKIVIVIGYDYKINYGTDDCKMTNNTLIKLMIDTEMPIIAMTTGKMTLTHEIDSEIVHMMLFDVDNDEYVIRSHNTVIDGYYDVYRTTDNVDAYKRYAERIQR